MAEAVKIAKSYTRRPTVRDLSTPIVRADLIFIIGANGAGRTTLLKMLIGALTPDSGTVKLGTNLAAIILDHRRETLDREPTLETSMSSGAGETVSVAGQSRYVVSCTKDFLSRSVQARASRSTRCRLASLPG